MKYKRQTRKKLPGPAKPEVFPTSNFLILPPELRVPIISKLSLNDALALRLTCQILNIEVVSFYPNFQMNITGDTLNVDQLTFINRIHLKRIMFKRISKPIMSKASSSPLQNIDDELDEFPLWSSDITCTRRKIYSGPCQYMQIGGIQIRSLSAPKKILRSFRWTATTKSESRLTGQQSEYETRGELNEKVVYDYARLKNYLLSVSSDDIFKHIKLRG